MSALLVIRQVLLVDFPVHVHADRRMRHPVRARRAEVGALLLEHLGFLSVNCLAVVAQKVGLEDVLATNHYLAQPVGRVARCGVQTAVVLRQILCVVVVAHAAVMACQPARAFVLRGAVHYRRTDGAALHQGRLVEGGPEVLLLVSLVASVFGAE